MIARTFGIVLLAGLRGIHIVASSKRRWPMVPHRRRAGSGRPGVEHGGGTYRCELRPPHQLRLCTLNALPLVYLVAAIGGAAYAAYLKRRRPEVY